MKRADRRKLGLTGGQQPAGKLSPAQTLVLEYQRTFTSDSGANVLKDLQSRFQKRGSFVPDSNVTAFHEGQRDVVRLIEMLLETDHATIPQEN